MISSSLSNRWTLNVNFQDSTSSPSATIQLLSSRLSWRGCHLLDISWIKETEDQQAKSVGSRVFHLLRDSEQPSRAWFLWHWPTLSFCHVSIQCSSLNADKARCASWFWNGYYYICCELISKSWSVDQWLAILYLGRYFSLVFLLWEQALDSLLNRSI